MDISRIISDSFTKRIFSYLQEPNMAKIWIQGTDKDIEQLRITKIWLQGAVVY